MNTLYFISVLFLALSVASAAPCAASASITPRQGSSWQSSGVSYQLYDIAIVNSGSYAISNLIVYFTVSSGSTISSTFNYDSSSGLVSGYGGLLYPQASFNGAGFTIAGTDAPTLSSITPTCPSSPSFSPSSLPTTAPATSSPTPPSTPTSAPTSMPLPTQGNCYNECTQQELCITDQTGVARCRPQICAALDCGAGHVCINDGGLARCIQISGNVSATPAPVPTQLPTEDNCYNECTGTELCRTLDASSSPQCHETRCVAIFCEDGLTCTNFSGIAVCTSASATSAPSSAPAAPTLVPSSAPSTTPALTVTQTPTFGSATLSPSCDCLVSATVSMRPNAAYVNNGASCQIYDLTLTSLASSTVSAITMLIEPISVSALTQEWNLTPNGSNKYDVSTYGALNGNGVNYYGAGFVVCGSGSESTPSVSVSSYQCTAQ